MSMPSDWLGLVEVTDGFAARPVHMLGATKARVVRLDDEDLSVLAESDTLPWFVAVSHKTSKVLVLSSDEDVRLDVNDSFVNGLKLLAEKS